MWQLRSLHSRYCANTIPCYTIYNILCKLALSHKTLNFMSQLPANCSTEFFSKHFKKSELFSDIIDFPSDSNRSLQFFQNLTQVNLFLEFFRFFINNIYLVDNVFTSSSDKKIIISSGFRTEAHNKLVGGVPNSLHCVGLAVDFSVSDMKSSEIIDALSSFFDMVYSYDININLFLVGFINTFLLIQPDYFGDINGKFVHIEFKYKVNYGY